MPNFAHDCTNCTYLGEFIDPRDGKLADLYHCTQGQTNWPTVIARFSDDGPDYASGMVFATRRLITPLVEAKLRAMERGLNVREPGEEVAT